MPTDDGQIAWSDIGGKRIATFDDHHQALIPWARWADRTAGTRLITIDYHCDTHDAFLRASYDSNRNKRNEPRRRELIDAIDPDSEASVRAAVDGLRHDEHIDAAIQSGIIDAAFIVAKQNERSVKSRETRAFWARYEALDDVGKFHFLRTAPRPVPPMTYDMPADRMVAIDPPSYLSASGLVDPWPDRVLETDHLDERLGIFDAICRNAGEPPLLDRPYILDIDLDAFNSHQALAPDDPSTFAGLVRNAVGITIAREPWCFGDCWDEGPAPSVTWAEGRVVSMILSALGSA